MMLVHDATRPAENQEIEEPRPIGDGGGAVARFFAPACRGLMQQRRIGTKPRRRIAQGKRMPRHGGIDHTTRLNGGVGSAAHSRLDYVTGQRHAESTGAERHCRAEVRPRVERLEMAAEAASETAGQLNRPELARPPLTATRIVRISMVPPQPGASVLAGWKKRQTSHWIKATRRLHTFH
jgi:hypothetical protein